jgi:NAD(P)-dependent dehydrogenase (short-subunit alcohol dehydrogenase family)
MTATERYDVTGRVAIITGGGTGIGGATAMLLAQRGADVVLAGRRAEKLERAAAGIRDATGRRVLEVPTDVRKPEQVQALIDRTAAEFGRIDILINNAGGAREHKGLSQLPAQGFDRDVQLNLSAAQYCSQAALRRLRASGHGAIVNISSLAGVHGTKGVGAYSAAKAGLQMLTRVQAAEWGPTGVRVNCVAPGMTATEAAREGWGKRGFDAKAASQIFPLKRYGEMVEVAQAIAFFACDASSYCTGITLAVGGGPQMDGMKDSGN